MYTPHVYLTTYVYPLKMAWVLKWECWREVEKVDQQLHLNVTENS